VIPRTRQRTPPAGGHHHVAPALHALLEPLATLHGYPGNARVHDLPTIAASLEANGQYKPLVGQVSTRTILVGNGTLVAAVGLGWSHLAVGWLDVDDDVARPSIRR
jgi:hypothetical protein